MDTQFQTSFIPKAPTAIESNRATAPVSVTVFIATVIFFASLVGAGVVYFYKGSLTASVSKMHSDLDLASQAFDPDFILEMQTLDKRLNAASEVLSKHVAVSPIFAELQSATLKSIQFTKFSYGLVGEKGAEKIDVKMSGRAGRYESLALESDELAKNKYIKDPIFSNLTLDEQGNVLFDLEFYVDAHFVSFGETLSRAPQSPPAALPVIETSPTVDIPVTETPSSPAH